MLTSEDQTTNAHEPENDVLKTVGSDSWKKEPNNNVNYWLCLPNNLALGDYKLLQQLNQIYSNLINHWIGETIE